MRQLNAVVKPPKQRTNTSRDRIYSGSEYVNERPSELLVKAGILLAKMQLNPLLTEEEHKAKTIQLAGEIVEAHSSGNYETALPPLDDGIEDGTSNWLADGCPHIAKTPLVPPLTHLAAPSTTDIVDPNRSLLERAEAAAIVATNGGRESDIKSRYLPALTFFSHRDSQAFGNISRELVSRLERCGATPALRFQSLHTELSRKHGSTLVHSKKRYRISIFCYGVVFEGDTEVSKVYGSGHYYVRGENHRVVLIRRGDRMTPG